MTDDLCPFGPADLAGPLGENLLALNNAHARELSWLEPDHLARLVSTAWLALRQLVGLTADGRVFGPGKGAFE